LIALFWLLRGAIRADRHAQFWLAAMVLSALPMCAVFPNDRLLLPVAIGGLGLVAHVLAKVFRANSAEQPPCEAPRRLRVLATFWIGVHLILAPLLLPLRSYSIRWMGAVYEHGARSLSRAEPLQGRPLVVVNGPDFFMSGLAPFFRRSLGLSVPEQLRVLGTTLGPVQVYRPSPTTLRLRTPTGYVTSPVDRLIHSSQPFSIGDSWNLEDIEVEVTAVNGDGRPTEIRCKFVQPWSSSTVWVAWSRDGYRPFEPPAVGDSIVLRGHSYADVAALAFL
jgi:hypothetical protein